MSSYVITGASRGIGLELTKQLLELPVTQVAKVFALTRSRPSNSLNQLIADNSDRLFSVIASVDNATDLKRAAADVKARLGEHGGLDVLVNNAGITAFSPGGTRNLTAEQLTQVLNTNVTGVHLVTMAFLPLLEAGKGKKVISMSSTLGAISWAQKFKLSPTPAYKISKAALNMLNTQYALDYADAGFTFLLVSPGWLTTDLGGEGADFPVDVGVQDVIRIILDSTPAQNGKFLNIHVPGQEDAWGSYDGKEISW
ncbi:Hypothetical protein R9X50_00414400 [Acrodontium crateriforme]|uniref:Uncharacterized protein n=1 Tax=Acrodontium crateriforme TaxID=150365 RepID=A0AAQ3RAI2_9PEZI|nr:Hypothetical protein R9X50_00414400 [Acrodontium crateriforme]